MYVSSTMFSLSFLLSFTVTFFELSTLVIPILLNFSDQEIVLKGEERRHWKEKSVLYWVARFLFS